MFTDSNISSMHINRMMTFFLFIKMPATLIQKRMAARIRTWPNVIIGCTFRGGLTQVDGRWSLVTGRWSLVAGDLNTPRSYYQRLMTSY